MAPSSCAGDALGPVSISIHTAKRGKFLHYGVAGSAAVIEVVSATPLSALVFTGWGKVHACDAESPEQPPSWFV